MRGVDDRRAWTKPIVRNFLVTGKMSNVRMPPVMLRLLAEQLPRGICPFFVGCRVL
jgi:hypothetical protein